MYNMKEMYFFLQNIRHLYLCIKSLSISLSGHINSILLVNNVQKKKKIEFFLQSSFCSLQRYVFSLSFRRKLRKLRKCS